MERKKSTTKVIRRLSSIKGRGKPASLLEIPTLPSPNHEFEDVLLSQLQVTDVMHNCVLGENSSSWSLNESNNCSQNQKGKQSLLYHRCYNDTTLIPLWQAFASLDKLSKGEAFLGRLMNLSSSLSSILGEDHHSDSVIKQNFSNYSQVPFSQYKRYVLDTTSQRNIDSEQLCATCWLQCKNNYLDNPIVDSMESVVPAELCDALYYLFCIFNKLTEPGTYPPTIDYEEAELILRKLFACLGMTWTSTYEDSFFNEDFDRQDGFEPNPPLQVTYHQLLSITADMIGVDVARSHAFYKATQRLCLIEYQEIIKSGHLMIRKDGGDVWKKRWGVLQSSKLTCYDTVLCQVVKEEVDLNDHMHVESLPNLSSHKNRFRVVEKEGFTITCEHEFSALNTKSPHSWITLINITIGIGKAGMSPKTGEICERRLERFNRRESVREVYRKKQDVAETYQKLQEAKKNREDIEEQLSLRARQREAQIEYLTTMDNIYERLESIQLQRRLHNKREREKGLMKMFASHEENSKLETSVEDSLSNEAISSNSLKELKVEESQLESELQQLRDVSILHILPISPIQSATHLSSSANTRLPKRSTSSEHHFDISYSSSENMSTASYDAPMVTLIEGITT